MSTTSTIDPTKLAKLIETEEAIFNDRHHKSREMTERARKSLAGGVASSWQATDPHPIYLAEGHGSKVVDVDGNEYVDFHNGYGAMAVGHAHPKIVGGRLRPRRPGHALRPADRGVDRRRRSTCRSASACRCGGSATRAPRRRSTPCG